jgi:hypothetical protein
MEFAYDRSRPVDLYVPNEPVERGTLRSILPGSAIVGQPLADDPSRTVIYFEGGMYNAAMTFATKVERAMGRFVERYPTVAMAVVPTSALKRIGQVAHRSTWTFEHQIDDIEAFEAWLSSAAPEARTV